MCCCVQVKGRKRECQLHTQSPLGETLLECYSCGSRNAFALGFVPLKVSGGRRCTYKLSVMFVWHGSCMLLLTSAVSHTV